MESAKPSLDLVRSVTDEHVLRALMRHRRLTRAELAAETGISKPTAGESVRRLTERGLLVDTGERTPGGRGKGRVGSYYALAGSTGTALAVAIAPEGVVAEIVDVYGSTVTRARQEIRRPARPADVASALEHVVATAVGAGVASAGVGGAGAGDRVRPALVPGSPPAADARPAAVRPRLAVVSAADPVDRATGRLVQLPDAPFLVGELDAVAVLGTYVDGPVTVDNDVNWAARAEVDDSARDFAYLYLGEGLGCAVVSDGVVQRGNRGLAGEIAYLLTAGPGGRAVRFIDVFAELGLRRAGSSGIHTGRLLAALREPDPAAVLRDALSGVVAAVVALADPGCVVLGGSWGPALLGEAVDAAGSPAAGERSAGGERSAAGERSAGGERNAGGETLPAGGGLPVGEALPLDGRMPWPVPVRAARARDEPAFAGARADALTRLRAAVVAAG
ncbi:ROK family transcriptional regulator [Actinoplanes sp. RD1]|uniref:ROK family transcriptional regulator n=1 Tax=Actinoplanes sp. RD1 TaxID=3064538 RepID=UPI002741CEA1|nr:ROK family transcriptional regulator [Actinoplanes sp. RD1]